MLLASRSTSRGCWPRQLAMAMCTKHRLLAPGQRSWAASSASTAGVTQMLTPRRVSLLGKASIPTSGRAPLGIPASPQASLYLPGHPPGHSKTAKSNSQLQHKSFAFSGPPEPRQAGVNIPSSYPAGDMSQLAGEAKPPGARPRVFPMQAWQCSPQGLLRALGPGLAATPLASRSPQGWSWAVPGSRCPAKNPGVALPHQGAPTAPGPGLPPRPQMRF